MDLYWATDYSKSAGNGYGYYTHNKFLREAVSQIANLTEDADNALTIAPLDIFNPVSDKTNWLFTMFEGTTLPQKYLESLEKADYLIVPSQWTKELFSAYFDENKIFVVNHGVSGFWYYKKRKRPKKKPFRFLWVGAPNARKGYEEIINGWKIFGFDKSPSVELYMKTTLVPGLQRNSNVICDGRDLTMRLLRDLYHSSHAFLLPHRGEGFGLTLAEAMATGLPSVATAYSGVKDFFDEDVGYEIQYEKGKGKVHFISDGTTEETEIAFPYVDQLYARMNEIRENYREALNRGVRASNRIKSFTWEASAKRLIRIIEEEGD